MLMHGGYYEMLPLTIMAPKEFVEMVTEPTHSPHTHKKAKVRGASQAIKQSNQALAQTELSKEEDLLPESKKSKSALSTQVMSFIDPLSSHEEPVTGYDCSSTSSQSILDASGSCQGDGTTESQPEPPELDCSTQMPSSAASSYATSKQTGSDETAASSLDTNVTIKEQYDFGMSYHDEDMQSAEFIYNFLEEELKLCGYMYSRDKTVGRYQLQEQFEAIERSRKNFLFITPQAMASGTFEAKIHKCLKHSIENGLHNVIPIYWQLNRHQGPSVLQSIYSIEYQNCNEKFKKTLASIFKISYQIPSSRGSSGSASSSVGSDRCTNSPDSPHLKQSQSLTMPKKKKSLSRFFSWNK